jgi:mycofactocin system creatininase family protein
VTARLGDLAWPAVPEHPVVLLPLGATEQHGPHLPFGTDTVIATAVADRLAEQLGESSAVVAPTLPFGSSGEHQDFPGTVSIGRDALRIVLIEAVRSITMWAGRVVIVNGHGGNVPTLAEVVPELVRQGHDVSWLPCSSSSAADGTDSHAGHGETSLLTVLRPEAVDLEHAPAGNTTPLPQLIADLARDGVRAVSPTGVLGDATAANPVDGQALLEAMVADALRRFRFARADSAGCLRDPERVTG